MCKCCHLFSYLYYFLVEHSSSILFTYCSVECYYRFRLIKNNSRRKASVCSSHCLRFVANIRQEQKCLFQNITCLQAGVHWAWVKLNLFAAEPISHRWILFLSSNLIFWSKSTHIIYEHDFTSMCSSYIFQRWEFYISKPDVYVKMHSRAAQVAYDILAVVGLLGALQARQGTMDPST